MTRGIHPGRHLPDIGHEAVPLERVAGGLNGPCADDRIGFVGGYGTTKHDGPGREHVPLAVPVAHQLLLPGAVDVPLADNPRMNMRSQTMRQGMSRGQC
jgi:hypothetical protein